MARVQRNTSVMNLRIPLELKAKIEHHAGRQKLSPAELMRRAATALITYLDQKETQQ